MLKLIHGFLMQPLNISQLLKDLMNLCFILNITLGSKSTSLKDEFQVYLSWPWVLRTTAKAVQYDLLEVGSHFWILCFSWFTVWADGINK